MKKTATRYLLFLGALALLFGLLDILFYSFKSGGVYWFNIDKERNIVTWFSGALFFLFGLASLVAWHLENKRNRDEYLFRHPWLWLGVALIGCGMSLDEITILHENILWRETRLFSAELYVHCVCGFIYTSIPVLL